MPAPDSFEEIVPEIAAANSLTQTEALARSFTGEIAAREERLPKEFARTPGSALKLLRLLHQAVDAIGEVVAPFAACRRGCNACCHIPVHLFPIEAELIEKRTGVRRRATPAPKRDFTGEPCPFLVNGECSIYEVRPLVCRRHFAMTRTAYWCEPSRSDGVRLTKPQFSGVESALQQLVRKDGRLEPLDIRQVFDMRREGSGGRSSHRVATSGKVT